jgi:hypothetical protein
MENVSRFRALGSICRQRAVFDPQNSWKHLGDAERWEHLAAVEISAHYQACNTAGSSETLEAGATSQPNDKPSNNKPSNNKPSNTKPWSADAAA